MRVTLLALGCLLIMGTMASAIPFLPDEFNALFFTNDEVWIDSDQSNTLTVGDYLWGGFQLNGIKAPANQNAQGGGTIWAQGANPKEITGYFVQKVVSVTDLNPADGSSFSRVIFAPITNKSEDPNGIFTDADVALGVMIKMYQDQAPGGAGLGNYNASTQGQLVSTSTDGAPLWDLALQNTSVSPKTGVDVGYWFANALANPYESASSFLGDAFAGVNVVANYSNVALFGIVNDPDETFFDSDVHFWFNSEITVNTDSRNAGFPIGASQKPHFFSNDPGLYIPIPEPTTLALFGLGLVGAFGLARRRRRT